MTYYIPEKIITMGVGSYHNSSQADISSTPLDRMDKVAEGELDDNQHIKNW